MLLNNEGSWWSRGAQREREYGIWVNARVQQIRYSVQRAAQRLPFNVAGLDTIKYSDSDFERLAGNAVDQAIHDTQQDAAPLFSPDQILEVFLLTRKALVTPLNTDGDRNIFQIGSPLGFNLLNDFGGIN